MSQKTSMTKSSLYANLVDYLPEGQKPFMGTKAYYSLCDALHDYLTADPDTREEKKVIMQHAKEVFEHMAATVQPPKKQPSRIFEGVKEEFLQ